MSVIKSKIFNFKVEDSLTAKPSIDLFLLSIRGKMGKRSNANNTVFEGFSNLTGEETHEYRNKSKSDHINFISREHSNNSIFIGRMDGMKTDSQLISKVLYARRTYENPLLELAKTKTQKISKTIVGYNSLNDNWDDLGAKKISEESIEEAFNFIKYIFDYHIELFPFLIFTSPTVNGGIGIEIINKSKNKKLIIDFDEKGNASYFLFSSGRLVFKNVLEDLDINKTIFKWLSV